MSHFSAVTFAVVSFLIAALALAGVLVAVLSVRRSLADRAEAQTSELEPTSPIDRSQLFTSSSTTGIGADDAL